MFMMDDDKLKILKTEVTSILTSSSSPLTVQQFLKEYKDVIGRHFPWSQHNYKNATEFIKSLTDTITFKNSDIGEVLMPIDSNSSHITKLVKGQKRNSKKGYASRRPRPFQLPRDNEKIDLTPLKSKVIQRPLPYRGWESTQPLAPPSLPNVSVPDFEPQKSFSLASSQQYQHFTQHNLWQIDQMPQSFIYNSYSTLQAGFTSTSTQLSLVAKKELSNELENRNNLMITNGYCENKIQSCSNPMVEVIDDDVACVKAISHGSEGVNQCKTGPSEISLDEVLENSEEYYCPISDKMKINFKKILSKNKDGLLVSKLASSYLKMFKAVLNCQDYGFRSIKDLVMACPDVFKIQPKMQSQDWLLYDVSNHVDDSSRWIPSQVLENMEQLTLANPKGISSDDILHKYKALFKMELNISNLGFDSLTSFLVNCQSIKCVIDDNEDNKYIVFPMKWGIKNEHQEISNSDPFLSVDTYSIFPKKIFEENVCDYHFSYKKCIIPSVKTLKILVADCTSPDNIWLQTLKSAGLLNDFMYRLNTYYDEEEQNFLMKEDIAHPGLACCVKYDDKQWHRALIEEKFSKEVMVLYVDYGTRSRVPYSELRTLHKKFSEEPIYSFQAKLHNIQPVTNGVWSSECINFLYNSVYDVVFITEIVEINAEVASVILVDTQDCEDKVINIILVKSGLALHIVKPESHPTVVEHFTPNYSKETNDHKITKNHEETRYNSKIPEEIQPNDYFLQLLPYWLTDGQSLHDINDIFKQASKGSCNQSRDDDNVAAVSSKQSTILSLFLEKPREVSNAWNKTFNSLIDEFEKRFFKNIGAEIEQMYMANNSSRLDNNYYESNIVSNRKSNYDTPKVSHPNMFDESRSNYAESNGSYQSKNSHEDHTRYEPFPGREEIYSRSNSSIHSCLVKENKAPKVIPTNICNVVINLIRYNSEIYVFIDELLLKFAKGLPSMLIQHRLSQQLDITPFIVTSEHKALYHELMRQQIDFENSSLVPLSLASNIVMAVQPRNKGVAKIFKDLSDECYTSNEFWSAT